MCKVFFIIFLFIVSETSGQCDQSVVPPYTTNSINITHDYSGSVDFYPNAYTSSCVGGFARTPPNSLWLGKNGNFNYTFNFSETVNNLIFVISATGGTGNENFVFSTNRGNPTIRSTNNCLTIINGNEIISGNPTNPNSQPSVGGGGGIFIVDNFRAFTSITISGRGGYAGSLFALCVNSIIKVEKTYYENIVAICPNDYVVVGNNYYTLPGVYQDTLINYLNGDSIVTTRINYFHENETFVSRTICKGDSIKIGLKTYYSDGVYSDTIHNIYGCDSILNIKLTLCQDAVFFIPDAFSPNGDQFNDVFKIEGEQIKEIDLIIFNRWGEKIHESISKVAIWDGNYQNQKCQDGIYFYQVKIKGNNLKVIYLSGIIHLIQ
jgi:gliding motility-associated-like protein